MSLRIEPHKAGYCLYVDGVASCYFLSFRSALAMARAIIGDED